MSLALRAAPLVFFAAVIQVATIGGLRILGAEPDLLLVTVVALALVAGSLAGAVAGFAGGLLVDVMTLGTLGVTSIILILVGYWAGRYGETTGRGRAYAAPLAAFALTIVAVLGGVALHVLLGQSVSGRTALVTVLPSALLAAALVLPIHRLCRRVLDEVVPYERARRVELVWNMSKHAPYGEPRTSSSRFLPPDPGVEAPYRLTPGLAFRVGVLGVVALAVFAVLFVRLWSLQVLSGDQHLANAQGNQLRTIRIEAPRGTILDRNGRVIVDNVAGTAVKLWVGDLPKNGRYDVIKRLAEVLAVKPSVLAKEVDERFADPVNPITVKTAVGEDQVNYLYEHQSEFPGVQIQGTFLRHYPYQSLAAQVLGYIGEVSQEELDARPKLYRPGDKVGKVGVEAKLDEYLRGEEGQAQITVDSLGRPQGPLQPRRDARLGKAVRLTIDIELQRAAERALRYGIQTAIENDSWYANGGALVALDPRDGAVLAMASTPTYKPSVYVGRVDPKKIEPLVNDVAAKKENYPGINRATSGEYPPGSTWKPVTALAAMQEHLLEPYQSLSCTPTATYGADDQKFVNWDPYVNHAMTLPEAMARSCDTYFYQVGYSFYLNGERGRTRMQEWARRFGFGGPTGIDVGTEGTGLVPTPAWRKREFTGWDAEWNPGDSIQLSIGQKDVSVTPLQMARFYAMIANGGKLVTPYVVSQVETPAPGGQSPVVERRFAPDPPKSMNIDPAALSVIRDGLYSATHSTYGTSSGVFANFPVPVAGKTGTAEKVVPIPGYPPGHLEDQSWWCGYGPAQTEVARVVVCAVIENGGHGSTAAAPAALRVFEKFFGVKAKSQVLVETD